MRKPLVPHGSAIKLTCGDKEGGGNIEFLKYRRRPLPPILVAIIESDRRTAIRQAPLGEQSCCLRKWIDVKVFSDECNGAPKGLLIHVSWLQRIGKRWHLVKQEDRQLALGNPVKPFIQQEHIAPPQAH